MSGRKTSQILITAVFVICGIAVWICLYLMELHSPIKAVAEAAVKEDSFWANICSGEENTTSGCARVVQGKFGTVKIPWRVLVVEAHKDDQGKVVKKEVVKWKGYPVPVAQLGLCYYIFVGVWFICTGIPTFAARRWHLIPLVLSCLAVCASIFFLGVMAFNLEGWCPLCAILHGIDFFLCAGIVKLWPSKPEKAKQKPLKEKLDTELEYADTDLGFRHFYATIACIVAICAISFIHHNGQMATAIVQQSLDRQKKELERFKQEYKHFQGSPKVLLARYFDTKKTSIPPRESASVMGDSQAKHEVVIFSDLQCPACRRLEARFRKEFLPLWKRTIKLTFRHFPLCTACNSRMTNRHPHACEAAYAVEAAKLQGEDKAFWQMHDKILQNQSAMKSPDFTPEKFLEYADELDLDIARLRADMKGDIVKQRVNEDIEAGTIMELNSTPTVFLDGRELTSSLHTSNPVFWKAIVAKYNDTPLVNHKVAPDSPSQPGAQ